MFTGLVEEIGTVCSLERLEDALRLGIQGPLVTEDASLGDSIAVNGVCLTVTSVDEGIFTADVMQESLDRTSLGELKVGSKVNLERALLASTRLGGHIMQGHVDGVSRLISRNPSENWDVLRFQLSRELSRYVVEKGSISLNGTSLTISAVGEDWFEVSLIPATLRDTTHGTLAVGETVNVEVDVLAKYVEKMLAAGAIYPKA